MAFECQECGRLHTTNPDSCRYCGSGRVKATLEEKTAGTDIEKAAVNSVGTTSKTTEGASSPDVNPDGSLESSPDAPGSNGSSLGWRRVRSRAEVGAIRTKGRVRNAIRLSGIVLVLLGGYNLLLGGTEPIFAVYRPVLSSILLAGDPGVVLADGGGGFFLADAFAMALGAATAWFV
ncbi:MAG: hypothetical protein ABEJ79_05920 [Halolamina sp.]